MKRLSVNGNKAVFSVEGESDQHADAEGHRHDRDKDGKPETALIEGVEIDPAAVFRADGNDHDVVNRRVNRCGKETEQRFLQGDFGTLFTEQERKQRHHRGNKMHMAVCAAELIAHAVKRNEEEDHRGKGEHQRNNADKFQQLRVFRKRVGFPSEDADIVNRNDDRGDSRQDIGVGRKKQEAFPAVVDHGVVDEKHNTIMKAVMVAVRQFNISEIPAFVFVTLLTPGE